MEGLFYFFVPGTPMTRCRERQKNGHNERKTERPQGTQKTKDRWGIIGLPLVFQPRPHAHEVPYTPCLPDASGPVNNGHIFTSHFVWVSSAPNAALRKPALADVCHSQQVNVAFLMKIWVPLMSPQGSFFPLLWRISNIYKSSQNKEPLVPTIRLQRFSARAPWCFSYTPSSPHSRIIWHKSQTYHCICKYVTAWL